MTATTEYRPGQYWRMADVCRSIGLPQHRMYKLIKAGLLPAPTHQVEGFKKLMYLPSEVEAVRQAVVGLVS